MSSVESMYTSLVEMVIAQSVDCHTFAGLQALCNHNQNLSMAQMDAMCKIAEKQGISRQPLETLVWLWTGGMTRDAEIAQALVKQAASGPMDDPAARWNSDSHGKLELAIKCATGLLRKTIGKRKPFCTVRVEGHQRNTMAAVRRPKSKLNPLPVWEWDDSAAFGFRVVDLPTAVVEVYIYDSQDGNDFPLGQVTFPLHVIEPGTAFQQEFEVEPMRSMRGVKAGNLGVLTGEFVNRRKFVDSRTF
eukprot:COSAG05_NODE_773_length_7441_cov_3.657042_3_plen_246_part_00